MPDTESFGTCVSLDVCISLGSSLLRVQEMGSVLPAPLPLGPSALPSSPNHTQGKQQIFYLEKYTPL